MVVGIRSKVINQMVVVSRGIMSTKGWFKKNISLNLGRGDKISFWFDSWADAKSLRELFPPVISETKT